MKLKAVEIEIEGNCLTDREIKTIFVSNFIKVDMLLTKYYQIIHLKACLWLEEIFPCKQHLMRSILSFHSSTHKWSFHRMDCVSTKSSHSSGHHIYSLLYTSGHGQRNLDEKITLDSEYRKYFQLTSIKVDTDAFKGLPLTLVTCDRKCELDGELDSCHVWCEVLRRRVVNPGYEENFPLV